MLRTIAPLRRRGLHTTAAVRGGPSTQAHPSLVAKRKDTVVRFPRDARLSFGRIAARTEAPHPHSAAHLHEEVELWKKVTAGGSVIVAMCLMNFLMAEHNHMHKPPPYPYLRIRNKPLPWGDGTKDLMDTREHYVDDHGHH